MSASAALAWTDWGTSPARSQTASGFAQRLLGARQITAVAQCGREPSSALKDTSDQPTCSASSRADGEQPRGAVPVALAPAQAPAQRMFGRHSLPTRPSRSASSALASLARAHLLPIAAVEGELGERRAQLDLGGDVADPLGQRERLAVACARRPRSRPRRARGCAPAPAAPGPSRRRRSRARARPRARGSRAPWRRRRSARRRGRRCRARGSPRAPRRGSRRAAAPSRRRRSRACCRRPACTARPPPRTGARASSDGGASLIRLMPCWWCSIALLRSPLCASAAPILRCSSATCSEVVASARGTAGSASHSLDRRLDAPEPQRDVAAASRRSAARLARRRRPAPAAAS